jgi:hypothetical protein
LQIRRTMCYPSTMTTSERSRPIQIEGVSSRTIQRAMAEGTIRTKGGSGHWYTLSPGEHEYLSEVGPMLFRLRQVLRTEPGVRGAVLFGSFAKGQPSSRSDIDLVVDFKGAVTGPRLARLGQRLSQKLGREVDLYPYSDLSNDLSIMLELKETGRPVGDRCGFWKQLQYDAACLRRHTVAAR